MSVCERVGTAGEALLEAYKPQPYTQLVNGKTMAQVSVEGVGRGGHESASMPTAVAAS